MSKNYSILKNNYNYLKINSIFELVQAY